MDVRRVFYPFGCSPWHDDEPGAVAEDRVPEPNKANCSGETYEQILASLSKEWDRNEFIANCKSFHAARKMTEWKFEKSPPDDF